MLPALYAGLMGWLRGGWQAGVKSEKLKVKNIGVGNHKSLSGDVEATGIDIAFLTFNSQLLTSTPPDFSILIAARNEAENLPQILRDLAAQSFPAGQFEVLIADDHSTDATAAIIAAAAKETSFTLRLIELPAAATGKKAALLAAQQAARAPWLVCTDADCRLAPGWLAAYTALLARQPDTNFISGPVLLTGPENLFTTLMGLEFAGLVGVGAACLARQAPTMCNGANLAYRRTAFEAVGGFAEHSHLASGDDEFLLHAIHARFPGTARFLFAADAIVRTAAPPTLRALLRQRVRWASKWAHYRSAAPQRLALLVLGANVALAAGVGGALVWPGLWPWVAGAAALKLGGDAWFLGPVLGLLGRRRWLAGLLPLQLLYAPYALAVGLAGLRGGYEWKGRAVR
ncbi:glycosyltransferase [Hymenobacter sp. DH14]|uniref:Glycosyltransferase n=1 Tax=Hymenobacter cyanobacteriorum TaxID=2926463 RepID=A0A9X1VE17_9BACT|nr:glycosyltransferase [Hymenobacter cyanobacteriorum]